MNAGRWLWFVFYMMMMNAIGFFAFDGIAIVIVFCFSVGDIFAWTLTTKNSSLIEGIKD